jgi:dihydropteroate synthase
MGPNRPAEALALAGGWTWFTHVEVLRRGHPPEVIPARDLPPDVHSVLTFPRFKQRELEMTVPQIMGILNATPDSFSDGGENEVAETAAEISRVVPVIKGLRAAGVTIPISIDTRKLEVASSAHAAGASIVNDVSGFTYDPALAGFCSSEDLPVCVMHALGDPTTMQDNPRYDDVLLDVYDFLEKQIRMLNACDISSSDIIADPGIGFGKTLEHNLALLSRLGLFHGLGVPLMLGASRKGFIGRIGNAPDAQTRAPGSIGVALSALHHGIQVLRVHDVAQTVQAIALWQAAMTGKTI